MTKVRTARAECPSCMEDVNVPQPAMGKLVRCGNCNEMLEVVWLDPLELDFQYEEYDEDEEEEEMDDDYDDYDYDD